MRESKDGQRRYICYSGLRRRGKESGASEGKKAIHRKMKKSKCLANKCLFGHPETMGPREDFVHTGLVKFLPVYHASFTL